MRICASAVLLVVLFFVVGTVLILRERFAEARDALHGAFASGR